MDLCQRAFEFFTTNHVVQIALNHSVSVLATFIL